MATPPTKHKNHTTIIVLSALSGLFLAIIVVGAILFQRKSRIWRRKGRESNPPSIQQINAAVDSPTQNNHDDNYASQGPQSLEIRRDHPRVQALQNTGYASSASATPEVSPSATPQQTDDEVDELPNVIAVRNKRRLKRQSSRDVPRLPNNEGADESLLDPKLQAANEGNFRGEESKGGGPVKISRKHSLEALKRKFSFSFEKDDYQPLGEEDPDEPQGSGEVSSKKCSGPAFSFKSLQRKLSLSEKEQDYQPVGREDPDEGQCKNFLPSCTEPIKIDGVEPMHQEQKEGSRVEFKCNVQGKNEVFYQWFKDGSKMQGQNQSTLVLSCVELRDFGFYVCQVRGVNSQSDCMKSSAAVLDVVPRDGMSLRCLRDVDPNIKSNIETLLTNKVHGGGGWRQVAFKYEMDEHHIDSLEGNPDAGKSVISYLKATYPDLTVYDFCKTLRERNIRRFDIIQKLLGQLSVPAPEKAS